MKLVAIRKNHTKCYRNDLDESFFYDWIRKKAREARTLDSDLASVHVKDAGPDTLRVYILTTAAWWTADEISKQNNIPALVGFFNRVVRECKHEFPNVKIITK